MYKNTYTHMYAKHILAQIRAQTWDKYALEMVWHWAGHLGRMAPHRLARHANTWRDHLYRSACRAMLSGRLGTGHRFRRWRWEDQIVGYMTAASNPLGEWLPYSLDRASWDTHTSYFVSWRLEQGVQL